MLATGDINLLNTNAWWVESVASPFLITYSLIPPPPHSIHFRYICCAPFIPGGTKDLLEFCAPGAPHTTVSGYQGEKQETSCTSPLLTDIILLLQSPSSHIKLWRISRSQQPSTTPKGVGPFGNKFLCHVICPWSRLRLFWMVMANCFQVKGADNILVWLSNPLRCDLILCNTTDICHALQWP